MCGIAGFLDYSRSQSDEQLQQSITRMRDAIRYRGPDDAGHWTDAKWGIALGHRRLSILDLSPCGHQPMISPDGRYVLIYNGEIYNFRDLRSELEPQGHSFRGHSDTEVLLAAISHWGLTSVLQRLNGMFAFAVWDCKERKLTLVRDRLGIKPLYFARQGQTFLFGSELKALRAHPSFRAEIDRDQLAAFLEHGYVPSPGCIYQRTWKLRPGHFLQVSAADDSLPSPVCYWDLRQVAEDAAGRIGQRPFEERLAELKQLLNDSVQRQLLADVPVGTFLSGGIDSSLVTAVAQRVSTTPVRAFTMGFQEAGFDETEYARQVAQHLGIEHRVRTVQPESALKVIPKLPQLYDEPFADSSQIPTYLVSQLAREECVVCLSGDGGDELFCGYSRYTHIAHIRRKIAWFPRPLRLAVARAFGRTLYALGHRSQPGGFTEKIFATKNGQELYHLLNQHWQEGEPPVVGGDSRRTSAVGREVWPRLGNYLAEMSAYDAATYLPDDILTKVDRASMAVGLEARVPLLDHRLVELAWEFTPDEKFHDGSGKAPLRSLLGEFVPHRLFDRPKMGFGVPLAEWLRGPLQEWAAELLSPQRLHQEAYLKPSVIEQRWNEHLAEKVDWHYPLWHVLVFQAWLEEQR